MNEIEIDTEKRAVITQTTPRTSLIIPSLNPDEKLVRTVRGCIEAGFDDIIIVNDGSRPDTLDFFPKKSEFPQVTLLTHEKNLGKGAALKTAFDYFLKNRQNAIGVVTADGDGQHLPDDIKACALAMSDSVKNGTPAVVLGYRDFSQDSVPPRSRFGNRATSVALRLLCGMRVLDTQTGLRAIPKAYIASLIKAEGSRYEYETNMLLLMRDLRIPYREVPIKTVYIDDNRTSHFHPLRDSLRVWGLFLKYALSSLSSWCVDELLFFVLGITLFRSGTSRDIFLCTAVARTVSSIYNFTFNKRVVFRRKGNLWRTLVRYYCLAIPVMISSYALVCCLKSLINVKYHFITTLIKIVVDTFLFFISFRIQRRWVFREKDI